MIGNQHTAQRIVTAYADFNETICGIIGCDAEQAAKITDYYLLSKIAKLDAGWQFGKRI